ncbi:polysaccharide deacetylase family protein [Verrucomicrobium sp. BvORR034]|uniref:polysaccharide deacetylase family protein n=1 Tax=Verrucomicrobium sp. BvORR034 TaxID=1396418 RepID=UPI002240F736|nr:polysaccharide deacetylase family protein [Verrucomicrobium sp. BvORR034]
MLSTLYFALPVVVVVVLSIVAMVFRMRSGLIVLLLSAAVMVTGLCFAGMWQRATNDHARWEWKLTGFQTSVSAVPWDEGKNRKGAGGEKADRFALLPWRLLNSASGGLEIGVQGGDGRLLARRAVVDPGEGVLFVDFSKAEVPGNDGEVRFPVERGAKVVLRSTGVIDCELTYDDNEYRWTRKVLNNKGLSQLLDSVSVPAFPKAVRLGEDAVFWTTRKGTQVYVLRTGVGGLELDGTVKEPTAVWTAPEQSSSMLRVWTTRERNGETRLVSLAEFSVGIKDGGLKGKLTGGAASKREQTVRIPEQFMMQGGLEHFLVSGWVYDHEGERVPESTAVRAGDDLWSGIYGEGQEGLLGNKGQVRILPNDRPRMQVAVTFDDGPHPTNTPKVLEALRRHGAVATFFILDSRKSFASPADYAKMVRRIVAEGHELGNHTRTHSVGNWTDVEVNELQRILVEDCKVPRPSLFRNPGGAMPMRHGHGARLFDRLGLPAIFWTVDSGDSTKGIDQSVTALTERVLNGTDGTSGRLQDGAIILLHDIQNHTVAAVDAILTGLRNRNVEFFTVSELRRLQLGSQLAGLRVAELPRAGTERYASYLTLGGLPARYEHPEQPWRLMMGAPEGGRRVRLEGGADFAMDLPGQVDLTPAGEMKDGERMLLEVGRYGADNRGAATILGAGILLGLLLWSTPDRVWPHGGVLLALLSVLALTRVLLGWSADWVFPSDEAVHVRSSWAIGVPVLFWVVVWARGFVSWLLKPLNWQGLYLRVKQGGPHGPEVRESAVLTVVMVLAAVLTLGAAVMGGWTGAWGVEHDWKIQAAVGVAGGGVGFLGGYLPGRLLKWIKQEAVLGALLLVILGLGLLVWKLGDGWGGLVKTGGWAALGGLALYCTKAAFGGARAGGAWADGARAGGVIFITGILVLLVLGPGVLPGGERIALGVGNIQKSAIYFLALPLLAGWLVAGFGRRWQLKQQYEEQSWMVWRWVILVFGAVAGLHAAIYGLVVKDLGAVLILAPVGLVLLSYVAGRVPGWLARLVFWLLLPLTVGWFGMLGYNCLERAFREDLDGVVESAVRLNYWMILAALALGVLALAPRVIVLWKGWGVVLAVLAMVLIPYVSSLMAEGPLRSDHLLPATAWAAENGRGAEEADGELRKDELGWRKKFLRLRSHDREFVASQPDVKAVEIFQELEMVEIYGRSGWGGDGLLSVPIRQGARANLLCDYAPSVFLKSQLGIQGTLAVVALYAMFPLVACLYWRPEGGSSVLVVMSEVAGKAAAWAMGLLSLYMIASNFGLLPLTGKNMIMLGLNSYSDLLEAGGLAVLMGWWGQGLNSNGGDS